MLALFSLLCMADGLLKYSINSFQKESNDSVQKVAIACAQSESNLLSQITEQFNNLVSNSENQDQIGELREAKNTLEERVRGNENMLSEIRNGRASAEKRETCLRDGNDKLLEELYTLREMALTPKKDSGPMIELQQLFMKYTSTSSALAECRQRIEVKDQKLQGQEEQIRTLFEQLDFAKVEQHKSNEEVETLSRKLAECADTAARGEQSVSEVSSYG
jgi:chromosome segregation ATPase